MSSQHSDIPLLLPSYPNAFIGRGHHIQAICDRLQKEKVRVLTLLGPGGIGKTRLSLQVAQEVDTAFPDGVNFVALDAVEDADQLAFYIAQRLGVKSQSNQDWLEEVIRFLANKEMLLILDNLEQIIESALQIDQILKRCPHISVLATSRIVLGLSYEIEYPLDGLSRPNSHLFPGPTDLLKFDAVKLFVQKAQTSKPNFALTEENAVYIVEICQKLDGLPLPIELAAARVKLFSPQQILQRLEQSLNLLKTKSKDVIPRHQTIQNTIQWSYDLLSEEEQRIFQQLSFFRSGFSLQTLTFLYPELDVVDLVESFVNKSLVVQMEAHTGEARFRMLKLIRDYGLQLLPQQAEVDDFYRAYSDYFAQLIFEGKNLRSGQPYRSWIQQCGDEYENIIAAVAYLKKNNPAIAISIGTVLWRFHLHRGYLEEGLEMIDSLLALPIIGELDKALLLEGAGALAQNRGNYHRANLFFKEGLAYWRNLGDKPQIIKALNNLGWVEWRLGNYGPSCSYSENALALAIETGDLQGQAKSLNNLSWTCMNEGQYARAAQLQRQVLGLQQQEGLKRGIAFAKTNLGWSLLRLGKVKEANPLIEEAIALFDEIEHQQLKTFARVIKAEHLYMIADWPGAIQLLEEDCIPQFMEMGDAWATGLSRLQLGHIYFDRSDYKQAAQHWNRALAIYQQTEDPFGKASAYIYLSRLHWAMQRREAAVQELDQGIRLAASLGAPHLLKDAYVELAKRSFRIKKKALTTQYLAIADHYAERLGPFQYQAFRKHIQLIIDGLQDDGLALQALPTKGVGEYWQQPDLYLANPIKEEELSARIAKLLGIEAKTAVPKETDDDPIIAQARQLIETHLAEVDYAIADLCRDLNISHSQLHRRIQAQTGLSISKFIRQIRLERAKELLADPLLTIAAVAIDTGFKDPDYFHRVFKQTFHITPGAFRRKQLQNK